MVGIAALHKHWVAIVATPFSFAATLSLSQGDCQSLTSQRHIKATVSDLATGLLNSGYATLKEEVMDITAFPIDVDCSQSKYTQNMVYHSSRYEYIIKCHSITSTLDMWANHVHAFLYFNIFVGVSLLLIRAQPEVWSSKIIIKYLL